MIIPNKANVVILAANFNPSIITKDWLYQNNILVETLVNFVNTPVFSNSETAEFQLIVDENRLQLTPKRITLDSLTVASHKLMSLVDLLPQTPYKAVGYNFSYKFTKDECNVEYLFSPNHEHIVTLTSEEYEIGVNILFPFDEFLVTLNLSPVLEDKSDRIVKFNYHSQSTGTEETKARLTKQEQVLKKTSAIVEALCQKEKLI